MASYGILIDTHAGRIQSGTRCCVRLLKRARKAAPQGILGTALFQDAYFIALPNGRNNKRTSGSKLETIQAAIDVNKHTSALPFPTSRLPCKRVSHSLRRHDCVESLMATAANTTSTFSGHSNRGLQVGYNSGHISITHPSTSQLYIWDQPA
jgi:SesB domain on fungal death-pathway protein